MSEHQYDIRVLEISVDPNPLMVERQDPDNFTRFQTRERCALEIAAYVFNSFPARSYYCRLLINSANSLDPDKARQNLDPNCLVLL